MRISFAIPALLAAALGGPMFADEDPIPTGVPAFDHVFVIMMESHGFGQMFNNPNTPFINQMTFSANYATNYFAVGHPSA